MALLLVPRWIWFTMSWNHLQNAKSMKCQWYTIMPWKRTPNFIFILWNGSQNLLTDPNCGVSKHFFMDIPTPIIDSNSAQATQFLSRLTRALEQSESLESFDIRGEHSIHLMVSEHLLDLVSRSDINLSIKELSLFIGACSVDTFVGRLPLVRIPKLSVYTWDAYCSSRYEDWMAAFEPRVTRGVPAKQKH